MVNSFYEISYFLHINQRVKFKKQFKLLSFLLLLLHATDPPLARAVAKFLPAGVRNKQIRIVW